MATTKIPIIDNIYNICFTGGLMCLSKGVSKKDFMRSLGLGARHVASERKTIIQFFRHMRGIDRQVQ